MVLTYFLNGFEMVPVAPVIYYWYDPSFYIPHRLYFYCKVIIIIIIITATTTTTTTTTTAIIILVVVICAPMTVVALRTRFLHQKLLEALI
jgi:hypothetical protein